MVVRGSSGKAAFVTAGLLLFGGVLVVLAFRVFDLRLGPLGPALHLAGYVCLTVGIVMSPSAPWSKAAGIMGAGLNALAILGAIVSLPLNSSEEGVLAAAFDAFLAAWIGRFSRDQVGRLAVLGVVTAVVLGVTSVVTLVGFVWLVSFYIPYLWLPAAVLVPVWLVLSGVRDRSRSPQPL